MRTSIEIKEEIISRFGFFPPFFQPALSTPGVLENLWYQTLTAYAENPLPALFKEKLAAMIARYCPVPYCLYCHTSTLRPLGMKADEILELLSSPSMTHAELAQKIKLPIPSSQSNWPGPGSKEEVFILHAALAIFLNIDQEQCHRSLRQILRAPDYEYLVLFLAYNRTALTWAEAHPELSFESDKRVQDNFGQLLKEQPGLQTFFNNYMSMAGNHFEPQIAEKSHLEGLLKEKSLELDEQRARGVHSSKMALLGQMAGNISHEISNPLAIIATSAKILNSALLKDSHSKEQMSEVVSRIEDTVQRMSKVVNGLNFFARDTSMEQKIKASVRNIVEDTLALCVEKFSSGGCKLIVEHASDDAHILCHPVNVSQALLNLISNSYDAVEGLDEKWIKLKIETIENEVHIKVSDPGKGIDPALRNKLMLPFFTTKPVGKGTGLGLSIAKGIAEQYQGKLFYSPDANTCFTLQFPQLA